MGAIKRKLQSKAGASMILALVFLLFCMLIGGSVLAAASVNGGRLKDRRENQQTMLDQRSAMLVMAETLKNENGEFQQLTITETIVEPVDAASGETATKTVLFQIRDADPNKTILEKLLYVQAAETWLNAHTGYQTIEVENYTFSSGELTRDSLTNFLNDSDPTFRFTPPAATGETPAELTISYAKPDGVYGDYDLVLYIQESVTENEATVVKDVSVLHLEMIATETQGESVERISEDGTTKTTIRTTTIVWAQPKLVKGGAAG